MEFAGDASIAPASARQHRGRKLVWFFVLPSLFYLICFTLLTFPLIRKFSTHFFGDDGDCFQYAWNLWWVNYAIVHLEQSPLYTHWLHFPYGCTLVGHTLDLTDGLIGVPLQCLFSLSQTYNLIVVFGFVGSGVATFWLAYEFCESWAGSLVAGFVFTFCDYHFAHAQGHLGLVSAQWMPLFLLFWHRMLDRAGAWSSIGASAALAACYFTAPYHFLYSGMVAGMLCIWTAIRKKQLLFFWKRAYLRCAILFVLIQSLTVAPAIVALMLQNSRDPFSGSHPEDRFSMDVLAPFVYGGHWRFARLTRFYWGRLPGNIHESSVYVGVCVWIMIALAWFKHRRADRGILLFWTVVMAVFGILALGSAPQIAGHRYANIWLPYRWFEKIPGMKLSGMPVRMAVMMQLAAAMLCAFAVRSILASGPRWRRYVAPVLAIVLIVEYLPARIPATTINPPEYVTVLLKNPAGGAVIDLNPSDTRPLYYATIHHRPLAFGYLARIPRSVDRQDTALGKLVGANEFPLLSSVYGFHFLVEGVDAPPRPLPVIHRDAGYVVYEFGAFESKFSPGDPVAP